MVKINPLQFQKVVKVESCSDLTTLKVPGAKPLKGFNVIFDDTILFPEGGGQNDDHGIIWNEDQDEGSAYQVKRVVRKNGQAVHFVLADKPFEKGVTMVQKIDWTRRFDHMQQHTGQHLISSIFDKIGIETLSWWMAENEVDKVGVSYIELDTKETCHEQLEHVEDECNQAIRDHLEVKTLVYTPGSEELQNAKTRGLPDDHEGSIRVIKIGDIDQNMCCGTHVSNLSQLQMVKILYTEKKKNKFFLYFLVGSRVNQYLAQCFKREKDLTSILNGGPEHHGELTDKAVKNCKKYQKCTQNLLKEMATLTANQLKATKPKFYSVHRPEMCNDFINILLTQLGDQDIFILVTMGNDKEGPCQLAMSMNTPNGMEVLNSLGASVCEALQAKARADPKTLRTNGKFLSLKNRDKADKIIEKFFSV